MTTICSPNSQRCGAQAGRSASRSPVPDRPTRSTARWRWASFDTVQATWNLLERSAGPALQRAHDAGSGVIVKEALANGRLTIHGAKPDVVAYARDRDLPPDAVAIAAALSQPWSDVVLSGAVSPAMLHSNLRARELALEGVSPADELSQLRLDADSYWQRRSELPWR